MHWYVVCLHLIPQRLSKKIIQKEHTLNKIGLSMLRFQNLESQIICLIIKGNSKEPNSHPVDNLHEFHKECERVNCIKK